MTVKELKEFLENVPDDTTIYIKDEGCYLKLITQLEYKLFKDDKNHLVKSLIFDR